MYKDIRIYIAGHRGMVGGACWRLLEGEGYANLVGCSRNELDLTSQSDVHSFFRKEKIDVVIDAAARVGGIWANNEYPYEFLLQNMQIQNNLIRAAHENGVSKFIFLGSSCIYPRLAPQPLKEEHLLTGALEPTNQWYAIAKISGIKLVEAVRRQFKKDFVALMPTNLYGPGDNYDLKTSHVLPAMIRKFHEAKVNNYKIVTLWGTGTPLREFLYVNDLALAMRFALENELPNALYNVGSGKEISILELARLIQRIVSYEGTIVWDKTKPDGTPRKFMDSRKLNSLGWQANIDLEEGIRLAYQDFVKTHQN